MYLARLYEADGSALSDRGGGSPTVREGVQAAYSIDAGVTAVLRGRVPGAPSLTVGLPPGCSSADLPDPPMEEIRISIFELRVSLYGAREAYERLST